MKHQGEDWSTFKWVVSVKRSWHIGRQWDMTARSGAQWFEFIIKSIINVW